MRKNTKKGNMCAFMSNTFRITGFFTSFRMTCLELQGSPDSSLRSEQTGSIALWILRLRLRMTRLECHLNIKWILPLPQVPESEQTALDSHHLNVE